jgi:hypothetical protein
MIYIILILNKEKEEYIMVLKKCKECGTEVSSKGICPKCGKDQRNFFIKHKVITFMLIVIFSMVIIGINENKNGELITTGTEATQKYEKLNLEKFNKIETGMTYEQVVAIIGEEGTVLSESEISNIKTIIYSWYGKGSIGANANITFQNGKVISKAQFGLK